MRMLMKVSIPVESGNKGVKDGLFPKTVQAFVDQVKPESCYFAAEKGQRTGYFVFDLKDPTLIPSVAEPFFMGFNASIEITPAMSLDEMKTGVDKAMKQRA
ncbi:MAG TPA: DUF3303 family protein [Kofleriaceae bacterium]